MRPDNLVLQQSSLTCLTGQNDGCTPLTMSSRPNVEVVEPIILWNSRRCSRKIPVRCKLVGIQIARQINVTHTSCDVYIMMTICIMTRIIPWYRLARHSAHE